MQNAALLQRLSCHRGRGPGRKQQIHALPLLKIDKNGAKFAFFSIVELCWVMLARVMLSYVELVYFQCEIHVFAGGCYFVGNFNEH